MVQFFDSQCISGRELKLVKHAVRLFKSQGRGIATKSESLYLHKSMST